jgi:dihydroorotase
MKTHVQILLKGGLIVDPLRKIHQTGSVAVSEGKIVATGEDLPECEAERVFDMRGKIIAPGLIDIHCHPVAGLVPGFFWPDEVGVSMGVTALCDGGTTGAANFETLRRFVIEPAMTDVFCFLNLAQTGLVTLPWNYELLDEHDISLDHTMQVIEAHRDLVKGIKIRVVQSLVDGMGLKAIEVAKGLSREVGLPLMMHIGSYRQRSSGDAMDDFSRAAVSLLEEGDILSHYLTCESGGMITEDGMVYPELFSAQERGVLLDSCHGFDHFSFKVARHALRCGLEPSLISTDLVPDGSLEVQSLAVTMSKFIYLGLELDKVIAMTTINPARALKEEGRRGSLTPGMPADITVIEAKKGDYTFSDARGGEVVRGEVLLEPTMVFKAGKMMPAYSGYHIPPVHHGV